MNDPAINEVTPEEFTRASYDTLRRDIWRATLRNARDVKTAAAARSGEYWCRAGALAEKSGALCQGEDRAADRLMDEATDLAEIAGVHTDFDHLPASGESWSLVEVCQYWGGKMLVVAQKLERGEA